MNLKHLFDTWTARRRRRADLRDMLEIDERLLRDMGLTRADLWRKGAGK